jgi:hypothetical protein
VGGSNQRSVRPAAGNAGGVPSVRFRPLGSGDKAFASRRPFPSHNVRCRRASGQKARKSWSLPRDHRGSTCGSGANRGVAQPFAAVRKAATLAVMPMGRHDHARSSRRSCVVGAGIYDERKVEDLDRLARRPAVKGFRSAPPRTLQRSYPGPAAKNGLRRSLRLPRLKAFQTT